MKRLLCRIRLVVFALCRALAVGALVASSIAPHAQNVAPERIERRAIELSMLLHVLVQYLPVRGYSPQFAPVRGLDPRLTDIRTNVKDFFPTGLSIDDAEKLLLLAGFTVSRGNPYMPPDTPQAHILSARLPVPTDSGSEAWVFVSLTPSLTQGALSVAEVRAFVLKTRALTSFGLAGPYAAPNRKRSDTR